MNEWMKMLWKIPGKHFEQICVYICMDEEARGCAGGGTGEDFWVRLRLRAHRMASGWLKNQWAQNIKALDFHVFMFAKEPSIPLFTISPFPFSLHDFRVCAPISMLIPISILIPLEIAVCALAAAFSICKLALNESMDFASFLVLAAVVSEGSPKRC